MADPTMIFQEPARSCEGQSITAARRTVVGLRLIVDDGRIVTLDMAPVIREHNRNAARLAALQV